MKKVTFRGITGKLPHLYEYDGYWHLSIAYKDKKNKVSGESVANWTNLTEEDIKGL